MVALDRSRFSQKKKDLDQNEFNVFKKKAYFETYFDNINLDLVLRFSNIIQRLNLYLFFG